MMTTRDRSVLTGASASGKPPRCRSVLTGASASGKPPRCRSLTARRIVEQPGKAPTGETGHGALVVLHGPGPEVEVDRADGGLDRPPQRPAVLPGRAEQHGPRDLRRLRAAVVRADQVLKRLVGELALGPDVAELEAGIVVARVLVVDQPDVRAVVNEVGGEQVVVARDRAVEAGGQRLPHCVERRAQLVVAVRDPDAALRGDGPVAALDFEHVEVPVEPL